MIQFQIPSNSYLSRSTVGFYHLPYTGMGNPNNPNYLNDLKNTYNSFPAYKLQAAVRNLQDALQEDLPQVFQSLGLAALTVCVVPRAKMENTYKPNQQLFRATVQAIILSLRGFADGTNYIRRHTNTYTTHLGERAPNYDNDGAKPYPGITAETCTISLKVRGNDILLIDDIYTPGVNIDEDAINALLDAGAHTVAYYAIGKV